MASEEQKDATKQKIYLAVFVAVVGFTGWSFGPGLAWHLERYRKKKAIDPNAPRAYYTIASIYNATWREKEAIAVWEEFYLNWSGNEANLAALDDMLIGLKAEGDWSQRWLVPSVANRYHETNPRPAWIGGDQPHPLLQDILMDWGKIWEDKREYAHARPYYAAAYYCFPKGSKTSAKAEAAKLRLVVKGFGF